MPTQATVIFSTERYAFMRDAIAAESGFEIGKIERKAFPDGEHYRRILSDVAGRDVILLGGTVDETDTLELYDLACALVHAGAHILTLAVPWYGYQTMERAVLPGEVVVAKTRARLLSSIPTAGSGNRIVLMDLHTEGITQYFTGNIRPVHLFAKSVVLKMISDLGGEDFVLASTDAGRAKWVENLANDLGVEAAFVFKRRLSGDRTEVTALAADVKDRPVVIYDDMIRTGGSLIGAAQAFLDAGATRISAVATHGVLPPGALERLQDAGVFDQVAVTDTHPRVQALRGVSRFDGFLRVDSVAPLFASAFGPSGPASHS